MCLNTSEKYVLKLVDSRKVCNRAVASPLGCTNELMLSDVTYWYKLDLKNHALCPLLIVASSLWNNIITDLRKWIFGGTNHKNIQITEFQ